MARTVSSASRVSAAQEQRFLRRLLSGLRAISKGNFSTRLATDANGVAADVAEAFNAIAELNCRLQSELQRLSAAVGREGRITARASTVAMPGDWGTCVESANTLVADLSQPIFDVSRVIGAVADGDLSQRMSLEFDGQPVKGEFLKMQRAVNTMADRLSAFSSEVTRVAREVGTEGKLGGQAILRGVAGTWKDLTDSVNSMARNLTSQAANIAQVTP